MSAIVAVSGALLSAAAEDWVALGIAVVLLVYLLLVLLFPERF